jgi:purine-cytosine permease-like protein
MLEPGPFREAIRTATVSYPIPFIVAVLLAFALSCFGAATLATDVLRWLVAGTGMVSALGAILIAGYAVVRKDGLLRSERHILAMRYMEALGDSDMDAAKRADLGKFIQRLNEPAMSKKAVSRRQASKGAGHDQG